MVVKKLRERQEPGLDIRCFSVRVPVDVYNRVTDWAWDNRISTAKAITELLIAGLEAKTQIIKDTLEKEANV